MDNNNEKNKQCNNQYKIDIYNSYNNNKLIEELIADIKEKSSIIKKFGNDIKEKANLSFLTEYNELYSGHNKISNEKEGKLKQIIIY